MAEHEFCAFVCAGAVAGQGPFGEGFEVFLSWCAGREEQEHRGGLAGLVAKAVDPAFADEEEVSGSGVGPAPAVIEPHRPGQYVERLGDGLVEVRVWPGRRSGEVPAVEAELAAGGRPVAR